MDGLTEGKTPPRWRRPAFLIVSALVFVGTVLAAHAVMLPFVLALVLAYVLTPLVARVEKIPLGKKHVPRGLAIVIVYVVVLGTIGVFFRGIAPRVGQELRGLRSELPKMATTARDEWLPEAQEKLRSWGVLPPAPAPVAEKPADASPITVRPQPDGSYAVDVGPGLEIRPAHGGYTVQTVHESTEPFDPNKVVADVIGKSFAYAQRNALELARIGRDIVAAVSRGIFIFGITLMLAAYLMLTRERVMRFFSLLARPSSRADFGRFLVRVDRGLSGVVRGQLVICLLNGILSAIGFAGCGLKYWPVMAIVATVFSLIPIFGSIASAVPAVALGLTQGIGTAAFVLVWIILIHQLEANFLNPKIMGDAAKIHPVLVIFSLLVGEHFFGVMGALLAVPCMSIAQSSFLQLREVVQRDDPEFAADPPSLSSLPPPPLT